MRLLPATILISNNLQSKAPLYNGVFLLGESRINFGILKSLVKKYGVSFSNKAWDEDNFKYSLPSKEDLSYILFLNNIIVGFIIASLKNESVYIRTLQYFFEQYF